MDIESIISDNHEIAPIVIVMGQSNAHGHAARLNEKERITEPLTNVKGLSREQNQSYEIADVTWSGFLTEGMNLGETQDHTCCLADEFARMWESESKAKAGRLNKGIFQQDRVHFSKDTHRWFARQQFGQYFSEAACVHAAGMLESE